MQGGHYTAYVRTRTPINLNTCKLAARDGEGVVSDQDQHLPGQFLPDGGNERDSLSPVAGSEFDTSSGVGQWYYVSDSHVRTATESEVLKSQAYLLFYEQLPLMSQ